MLKYIVLRQNEKYYKSSAKNMRDEEKGVVSDIY
jgi:hypothetical protein